MSVETSLLALAAKSVDVNPCMLPLKSKVAPGAYVTPVVHCCAVELKEAATTTAKKIVEVKILLMTIKFKFKRFGYTAISRRNLEDSQKEFENICCGYYEG